MTSNCLKKRKKKELENFKNVKNIQSGYGIRFGIEKCSLLVRRSGKRQLPEEIEQPNQGKIRTLKKWILTDTWAYWKLTPSKMKRVGKNEK